MKIVQTNKAYYPKVGGIESTIATLSEGLVNKYSASVQVLVCNSKFSFYSTQKTINGVDVKYVSNYGIVSSLPISPWYFKELSNLSGNILHIHEPFPLADLSLLMFPKIRKNFKKIVVSWHSDIIRQKWVLAFYRKYLHNFLELADKITVSSPALIDNSEFLPAYSEKCEVIPHGVNLDWAKSRLELSENKKDEKLILFVGRLVYYKGIEYLIDAMSSVKNAKLLIIGSGPLKEQLISKIKQLELNSRIKIIPEVEKDKLQECYKNCDMLVLPSIEKSETYGIVQIEAMACGKPIICTEIGTGTSYINQNEVTGIVVPPRDSNELANAINRLVSDKDLSFKLGQNGKERAFNEFNAEKMVQRTYDLYENLIND
ncbi:MAG TPA: glycosyltransferase [Ignavibacteriaceae bacterium]|nr:glycosyltransferase [Ignavibacteriaceae bacterium]